jgi:O-antigen/teichoic acid export membrane protein
MLMRITEQSRKWIGRGAWAVADQGFFALANVLLNVMLARWLPPSEYGAFAVGYSIFLFIGAFHTALLTEPLLVFGPVKFAGQSRSYLNALLRGHWALTGVGSLLLIIAGGLVALKGGHTLAQALFGLAVAAPFSLLMWFGRRAAYLRFQPRLATMASAAYLLLLLAGLFSLYSFHLVSVFSALLVMSVAGALSGLWLLRRVRRAIAENESDADRSDVARDHWRYGRWAAATAVLMWVPLNFFFVVLSILINLEASAALKALTNLTLPLLQANAALGSLLLPALVMRARNAEQFRKLLIWSLILFVGGASVYSLGIGTFSHFLVNRLYGGVYDSYSNILWLLLSIPIFDGAMVVLANALRALERPDRVFWAHLGVAVFILTAGVLITQSSGLWGAAGSVVFADFLGTMILAACVITQLRPATLKARSVTMEPVR